MNLKKVEQCKIQVSPSPMRAHSYACDVKLSCLALQSYSESFAKKKKLMKSSQAGLHSLNGTNGLTR